MNRAKLYSPLYSPVMEKRSKTKHQQQLEKKHGRPNHAVKQRFDGSGWDIDAYLASKSAEKREKKQAKKKAAKAAKKGKAKTTHKQTNTQTNQL